MHPVAGLLLSYVLGSIPAAYMAGKLVRGIDLRQHGSGNLGATNVYRVLGAKTALVVLLIDALKGALPVLLLAGLTTTTHPERWAVAYGIAAIAGHVRPVFLLWTGGGTGVATAAGVFFALAPLPMLITTVVWMAVVYMSGYVSLASLAAALVLPAALLALGAGPRSEILWVSFAVSAFVFWTHRANIGRLRRGEESRFGRKSAAPSGGGAKRG